MKNEHSLFTPRLSGCDRVSMALNRRDQKKVDNHGRGPGFIGTVTDQLTGERYRVYGAECDQPPCHCDALAVPADDAGLVPKARRRLDRIEACRARLHSELADVHSTTPARRVRINVELDRLANEERRLRGEAE